MSAPSEPSVQFQRRWRWWHVALLSLVAGLAVAPFDAPIARLCTTIEKTGLVNDTLSVFADLTGGGLGVLILLAVIVAVDRARFSKLPMFVAAALGAGLIADVVKLFIHRWRPHSMDLTGATFASTFGFPFEFVTSSSREQSFPSGHAATAFGFAIAVAYVYPRMRWPLVALATLTSIARVMLHAHYPTDVVAGALLGVMWAMVCQRPSLTRTFTRWGEHLDRKLLRGWSKLEAARPAPTTDADVATRNAA